MHGTYRLGGSQSSSVPLISPHYNQTEGIYGAASNIRYTAGIKAVVHRPICGPSTMLKSKR